MPQNVWGYAWHLKFEYFIVPCDCVLEPMLTMHCDFGHTVLISEKKTAVAVYHYFRQVIGSALQNGLEHLIDGTYKLYLKKYDTVPCSLVNIADGIVKVKEVIDNTDEDKPDASDEEDPDKNDKEEIGKTDEETDKKDEEETDEAASCGVMSLEAACLLKNIPCRQVCAAFL